MIAPIRWILPAALAALVILCAPLAAPAATVTMTTTNASGSSWVTPTAWDDGLAAHSGADYVVNNGFIVRSPVVADPTFPGDSLTLNGTGEMRLKNSGVVTINNLKLGGVLNNGDNGSKTVGGSITVLNTTSITGDAAGTARTIVLNALLSGSAAVNVRQPTTGTGGTIQLTLANASNSYTGLITVQSLGLLQYDYAAAAGGASVNIQTGGKFNLTQNVTFANGAFQTDGSPLAPGTYDFAALTTQGRGAYFNTGPGTITVTPEPSAIGLGVLFAGAALGRRRRGDARRKA